MPDNDSNQHPPESSGVPSRRDDARDARNRRQTTSATPRHTETPAYTSRRRRPSALASHKKPLTTVLTPRHASERYRSYSNSTSTRTRHRPSPATSSTPAPTLLQQEFALAQQVQRANIPRPGRMRSVTRRKWFWPIIGIPGILMIAILVAGSPILWSSYQAYRDVTVDSVERMDSAFMPQLNQQGTPELVARETEVPEPGWSDDERFNILLLGVDISAGGASRTDTLILVNIDPETKAATMMSIPRDLKVVIPGYGVHKINAAFALGEFNQVQGGGAGLTIRTIESNLGLPIHGFVQIDFQGFVNMIDTIGGVTLDVPYPIRDDQYPAENFRYQRIYFPAGWQHLDGEEALVYARTRHQDGDTMRSARQQQVLMSIRDQALTMDILGQLPTLIRQFGDTVRTDISIGNAVTLAQLGMEIPRDHITSTSILPALYEDPGLDGTYYLSADWDVAEDILTEFHGSQVSPPGAAISNPDYGASIMILNGTTNTGLAGRVGTTLENNGFWNVSVDFAENQGDHDQSIIVDRESNLGTSAMITSLIGVGTDTIVIGDAPVDTGTGIRDYDDFDIVIMLGNDAPDPAGDQWTLEDYQREATDEPAMIETPAPLDPTRNIDTPVDGEEDRVRPLSPVDEEAD